MQETALGGREHTTKLNCNDWFIETVDVLPVPMSR